MSVITYDYIFGMEVNGNAMVHTIVPLEIGSIVNPSWPTGFGIFKTVSFVDSRVSINAGASPALSEASISKRKSAYGTTESIQGKQKGLYSTCGNLQRPNIMWEINLALAKVRKANIQDRDRIQQLTQFAQQVRFEFRDPRLDKPS
jgi:hypothetical protein